MIVTVQKEENIIVNRDTLYYNLDTIVYSKYKQEVICIITRKKN